MPNNILFVFEGQNTEYQISDNLSGHFVNSNTRIECAFCGDVYQLYKKLYDDQDLDVFAVLKNRPQNSSILSSYNRTDFAEIYLFFDFDGHASMAEDKTIRDLLFFFDEETDNGKLFLSYPMIESIKHIDKKIDFRTLKVPARQNIKYKRIVHNEGDPCLRDLSTLTASDWSRIINSHLKKLNFITNNSYEIPKKLILQTIVFDNQKSKYLDIDNTIAVLNSFPVFLFDYYGYKQIKTFLDSN